MIERKILIGLITNTDYLTQLKSEWNADYIESPTARILASWCWEYFAEFGHAPMHEIDIIYIEKLKKGLNKSIAEEIETEILPELSAEFEKETITIDKLLKKTRAYFIERQIKLHNELTESLLEKGDVEKAKEEIKQFKLKEGGLNEGLDLSQPETLERVTEAFNKNRRIVIKFPGALGEFWNEELRRGGFVALMGRAKMGKTFWLLEFMMRSYAQKRKVAFFQAGDMTELEQLVRICSYLAEKPTQQRDCGEIYVPHQDCLKNQNDTCDKKIRECRFGVLEDVSDRDKITKQNLIEALKDNPDYKPCFNCVDWQRNKWGSIWLEKKIITEPLGVREAKKVVRKFFVKAGRMIKMASYANSSLTVSEIERVLDVWKRQDDFVPDVIIVDYADLLVPEVKMEFRHQQDHIWRRLRGLSQTQDALLITATQTDAQSYKSNRLDMGNFTEDRRKHDHVTATFGLNQDKEGREKEIGLMRVNRIVLREGDFHSSQEVNVLQQLKIGKPFLGSFY
jgi:hypothetical protein